MSQEAAAGGSAEQWESWVVRCGARKGQVVGKHRDLRGLSRFEEMSGGQRASSSTLPRARRDQAGGQVLWGGRARRPAALSLALGSPAEAGPDRGPEAAHRETPLPRAHAGDHPANAG